MRSILAALLGLLLAAAVSVAVFTTHPHPTPVENPVTARAATGCPTFDECENLHRRFTIWGDSLIGQTGPVIQALLNQREHFSLVYAHPGGAPCDELPGYGVQMADQLPINRVALAYVGNSTTPCMVDGLKSLGLLPADATRPPAVLTQAQQDGISYLYEQAIRAIIRWNLAHNIATVLVLPPRMGAGTWHGQVNTELVAMLTRVADVYGGVWTDPLPRDLLSPSDVYTDSIDGYRVRHTDRTHLFLPLGQELYSAGIATALVTGS